MCKLIHLFFISVLMMIQPNLSLIFVKLNTTNAIQDGSNEFPFQNLSIALKTQNTTIGNFTFILMPSDLEYDFFEEICNTCNTTIMSSSET